jgi:transcriptional regulator with XRE-family HTH domain
MNTIGNRLKEERARLGITQEKMALAGGVQKRAQARYESGERCPDGHYLARIAELGADVNYILTGVRITQAQQGDNGRGIFDEEDVRMLNMIKRLPEPQKKKEIADIEAFLQSFDEAISHWIATNSKNVNQKTGN